LPRYNVSRFGIPEFFFIFIFRIIDEAINIYGEEKLGIAFNGGKDCTAILHLYYACILNRNLSKINSVYVVGNSDESFEELEEFVKITEKRYGLTVYTQSGKMKEALGIIISAKMIF
jgi:FAD synthetase